MPKRRRLNTSAGKQLLEQVLCTQPDGSTVWEQFNHSWEQIGRLDHEFALNIIEKREPEVLARMIGAFVLVSGKQHRRDPRDMRTWCGALVDGVKGRRARAAAPGDSLPEDHED